MFNGFNKKDNKKEDKIIVSEVTHSVFYAPWYVALEKNYFKPLKIEVILTNGANNVIASLLSKDADIGLCGMEASIYVYKEKKDAYIKSFAGLTKRDGQLLILRNNIKYDSIKDLEGKTILAGRSGGMPLINFKEALYKNNINNVIIDTSIDFANLSSSFIAGVGDGVNLFEPNASTLVKNGYGYIADSIGSYSGQTPYTVFNALSSYIDNNKDTIKIFYEGINKGLDYVKNHTSKEIAEVIIKEFPDTSIDDLTKMIDNYKKYDSWLENATITEDSFNNLETMLIRNNEIDNKVPFHDLVYEFN